VGLLTAFCFFLMPAGIVTPSESKFISSKDSSKGNLKIAGEQPKSPVMRTAEATA
jgi:hypothetical protein